MNVRPYCGDIRFPDEAAMGVGMLNYKIIYIDALPAFTCAFIPRVNNEGYARINKNQYKSANVKG